MAVAKLRRFGGATRGCILGIKVKDNDFAQVSLWREFHAASGKRFEFG
jgi:hypothetical protein